MASLSNVDDTSRPKSRGRSFAGWMSDSEYMNELSFLCSEVSLSYSLRNFKSSTSVLFWIQCVDNLIYYCTFAVAVFFPVKAVYIQNWS